MNDYQFWLSQGLCPHCHKRKPAPGRHACPDCLKKIREREAASRKRKMDADPDYAKHDAENRREAVRRYRKRHKAMGLCVYCNNKAVPGITLCEKHRRLSQSWDHHRYEGRRTRKQREHLDPPEPTQRTRTDVGKLFALYNAGWKNCDIAAELKVTESTVYRWLRIAKDEKEGADADIS